MACTTFTISTSQAASNTNSGLSRSKSSKELIRNRAAMHRSRSDSRLACGIDRPRLMGSRSVGVFCANKSSFGLASISLGPFLFDAETSSVVDDQDDHDHDREDEEDQVVKRANWVERLMELRARWRSRSQDEEEQKKDDDEEVSGDCDGCEASYGDDDDDDRGDEDGEKRALDRESFSRFLVRVAWSDVKLFSQLAFLCNIAYVIPDIKAKDLKRRFGLKFVTSSLERKAEAGHQTPSPPPPQHVMGSGSGSGSGSGQNTMRPARASVAYGIAASAASYVRSGGEGAEVAACMAASTMTAVVAAGEREKSEAAKDLQSLHSSPCEWFICDDPSTYTRCFVIQGSDSLASWQANLFFEPTKFEETECLVHRGIYEAAKGMYTQFMPEIIEHLNKYGERAKLRFTGHSLGGSLSLLLHLMLLARKAVKSSALRPVVTFGSPFVFCGGHKMLEELGVDESQINCVVMHRDIVPRAFSCNYPDHVANLLKRLNGTFRSHPCLIHKKVLYTPIGKLLVLQPEEKWSPPHPLLPEGCSLYALDEAKSDGYSRSALSRAFLNNPHPLHTLSDPAAYGSDGTILRDHDSSNYLKAVNGVLKRNYNNNNNNNNNNYNYALKEPSNNNVLWPLLSDHNNWLMKEIMTGV